MSGPQWRENKTDDNNDNGIGNHANSEYEKKTKNNFLLFNLLYACVRELDGVHNGWLYRIRSVRKITLNKS